MKCCWFLNAPLQKRLIMLTFLHPPLPAQTPHTPKETTPSAASKAFFQTPGTLGNVVPAARKRGSAQRRLDVGHPTPGSRRCEEERVAKAV